MATEKKNSPVIFFFSHCFAISLSHSNCMVSGQGFSPDRKLSNQVYYGDDHN